MELLNECYPFVEQPLKKKINELEVKIGARFSHCMFVYRLEEGLTPKTPCNCGCGITYGEYKEWVDQFGDTDAS